VLPRELYTAPHVVNIGAARHREGATIVVEIPDVPRPVEQRRPVPKETSMDLAGEILEVGRRRNRYRRARSTFARAGTERSGASGGDPDPHKVSSGQLR
jgi:hypothetical protein